MNGCEREDGVSDCGSDGAHDNTLDDSMDGTPPTSSSDVPTPTRPRSPTPVGHGLQQTHAHTQMPLPPTATPRHFHPVINLVSNNNNNTKQSVFGCQYSWCYWSVSNHCNLSKINSNNDEIASSLNIQVKQGCPFWDIKIGSKALKMRPDMLHSMNITQVIKFNVVKLLEFLWMLKRCCMVWSV